MTGSVIEDHYDVAFIQLQSQHFDEQIAEFLLSHSTFWHGKMNDVEFWGDCLRKS